MIARRRGRVIVIDEAARRPIRLVPRCKRAPTQIGVEEIILASVQPDVPGV